MTHIEQAKDLLNKIRAAGMALRETGARQLAVRRTEAPEAYTEANVSERFDALLLVLAMAANDTMVMVQSWEREEAAKKITVCSACLQASCWQGLFMCQDAIEAGTEKKTRAELAALNLEHPCYWKTDEELAG